MKFYYICHNTDTESTYYKILRIGTMVDFGGKGID